MGGLEKVAYDSKEKILYGVSEQGFVSKHDTMINFTLALCQVTIKLNLTRFFKSLRM